MLMGLDLALENTGVAILTQEGHVLRTHTLEYAFERRTKRDAPITEVQRSERLIGITNDIVGYVRDFGIRYAALEDYAFSRVFQAARLGEIGGNVKVQLLLAHGLVLEPVTVNTARKTILGYGGSISKSDIVRVVNESFNINCATDHEADAVVVARCYFEWLQSQEAPVT